MATEELSRQATGETIYVLAWGVVGGATRIFNTVTGFFVVYSAGSYADYVISATEITGSNGDYVATIQDQLCVHGTLVQFDWRIQAGGSPATSDVSVDRYQAVFDFPNLRFVPPSIAIGQTKIIDANTVNISNTPVFGPLDLGLRTRDVKVFTPIVPTTVTLANKKYTFAPTSTDQLLRDINTIDPLQSSAMSFSTTTVAGTTVDMYVGLFAPPTDEEDISADLIDPSEAGTSKNLFRAGFIIRGDAPSQVVAKVGSLYYAVASTLTITSTKFRVEYSTDTGITLYDAESQTRLLNVNTVQIGLVDSSCAWGIVCNDVATARVCQSFNVGGTGYNSLQLPNLPEVGVGYNWTTENGDIVTTIEEV